MHRDKTAITYHGFRPAFSKTTQKRAGREKRSRLAIFDHQSANAPRPIQGSSPYTGARGIEHNISSQLTQVAVFFDRNSAILPLKKMSNPPVVAIDLLSVSAERVRSSFIANQKLQYRYSDATIFTSHESSLIQVAGLLFALILISA